MRQESGYDFLVRKCSLGTPTSSNVVRISQLGVIVLPCNSSDDLGLAKWSFGAVGHKSTLEGAECDDIVCKKSGGLRQQKLLKRSRTIHYFFEVINVDWCDGLAYLLVRSISHLRTKSASAAARNVSCDQVRAGDLSRVPVKLRVAAY